MQYPIGYIIFFSLLLACGSDGSVEQDAALAPAASVCSDKALRSPRDRAIASRVTRSATTFYNEVLSPSGFNGGMLIAYKGCIIFEKYRGRERLGTGSLMDSNSSLHLASVSKTFTAMAILKLRDLGKLNLDDDVSRYLPDFVVPGVTIRHLLSHRSGLPNYVHFMESIGWDTRIPVSNRDILHVIRDHRRRLDIGRPGRRFNYCNTNYALLALIIEHCSGISFPEYMDKTFFKPLFMKNTYVYTRERAKMAIPSFNAYGREEPLMFLDGVYGDKNIYSTPRDLLTWDQALYNGSLFPESTLQEAYTGYSHERHGSRNYGLGWRLIDHGSGRKVIYHNGWWHGNNTVFSRFPQDSATLIVLGNRYNRSIYDVKQVYPAFPGYGHGFEDPE